MGGQLDVRVLEPDDEAHRDVVLAHRIDERAAELAVPRPLAQRPPHGVDDLPERLGNTPHLFHAERPDLRVPALEPERVDRRGRQVARRPLGEDGQLCRDVDPGLEVRQRLAVLATALVARAHADDPAVLDEELLARCLGQDRRPARFGLLGEEAAELGHRDDPVPVVHHRRRRRDPQGGALGQQVDGLAVDRPVCRHLLDRHAAREQPADRPRVHHGAGKEVRAGLLPLLEERDRHLAEPLAHVRVLLQELAEPDSAREPAGAASDDEDADVDPLVGRVRRRAERLRARERRGVVGRADAAHRRARSSSVSFGAICVRSPTTPRSAKSKIGAFGSLLTATIVPEPCMPTLCWIAPEMPSAM